MALAAVFQIGSLGDTIVSLPAFRSLHELLPDCSDYLLISPSESQLHVQPNHIFDMVWKAQLELSYTTPGNGLSKRKAFSLVSLATLWAKLLYYRPKYCVYLMPGDRVPNQVERDTQFFRAARIPNLVGFRAITDADRNAVPGVSSRTTEAYLRFLRLWGDRAEEKFPRYSETPLLAAPSKSRADVTRWLTTHREKPVKPLVALCPYSNYPSRNIPHATSLELLKRMDSELDVEVVILGGKKDSSDAGRLIADAGAGLNACAVFTPEQSTALLETCALAVCTESGPMHLAGALGIPTVVTFSRINKILHSWFPLGRNHTILFQDVPCAGCRQTICPIPSHPCMRNTTAGQIFRAVASKLSRGTAPVETGEGTLSLDWPGESEFASLAATRADQTNHVHRS